MNKKTEWITCEEKYKDEIERLTHESKEFHPAVRNGKPVLCIRTPCNECDLYDNCDERYKEWLKSKVDPYEEESEDYHMIAISSSLWKSLRAAADYQIPKEPEKVCSGYADGHQVYDDYCPKCGNELDEGDKVCHECGQLIDWSDGKEE